MFYTCEMAMYSIVVVYMLLDIYRLDRLTSGVLIMAKTVKKTQEMEEDVLHRRISKEYMARVVGEFPE